MIQEGTAFVKIEDVRADDSEWLNRIASKTFLKFFPHLKQSILQVGEIIQYPRGAKISLLNTRVTNLSIPLDGRLILKLSAGKITDERVLNGIEPFETIGFREIFEGKIYPFSVETEANITHVFSLQRVDLARIFQDPNDIEMMSRLSSSRALYDFCSWLLLQKVEVAQIRKIILCDWTQQSFEKFRPVQLKQKSILLVESGLVQATLDHEDQNVRSLLGPGEWFGGSSFNDLQKSHIQFSFLADSLVNLLPKTILDECLPISVIQKLQIEPRIQTQLNGKQVFEQVPEIPGDQVEISFTDLGYSNLEGSIQSTEEPSLFASTTIWNLMQFFDLDINEKQVQALIFSRPSMNLGACAQILEDIGFVTKIVKMPRKRKASVKLPLLHYAYGRPVLILRISQKYIIYLDPQLGLMEVEKDVFENKISNYFLSVQEPFSKLALKEQLLTLSQKPEIAGRMLLRYFVDLNKKEIKNIFIFKLFQSFAVILVPSYLLGLINQVLSFKKLDYMPVYYTGLGIFIAFQVVAIFFNNFFTNNVLANFKSNVQPYFYRLFLNQPNNFVTSVRAGFIQSRLGLIDYALTAVKMYRIEYLQNIISLVLFLVVVAFYSWQASVVLLVFSVAGAATVLFARKNGGLDEINTAQQRQEVLDSGFDFLNGLESIKLNRSEKWTRDRFEQNILQLAKGTSTYLKSMNIFNQIGTLIFQLGSTLALFTVIQVIFSNNENPSSAFAVSMYLGYCLGPYTGILNVFFNYNLTGLYPVPGQMIRGEPRDRYKSLKVISLKGDLRFERVSFRYSDRHPFVINDVSFHAKEGEVVAIVGRSGSGKTTLARLISRQAEISGGKIYYDDIDSRLIDGPSLAAQIGFVSQTPTLFSGSIAQNISLSEDTLNIHSIVESARAANADLFIEKLPGKYNYRLKEGGRGLSGGEKQQIAMARILYSRPHILILDEATANMDPKAERIISDKLLDFHGKQTVFVVVQKISTARRADKIIVMKAGRIVEVGEHNKLLAMNGEYAELYRHQVGEGK